MEVEVTRLRKLGEKLTSAQLERPVRGKLSIERWKCSDTKPWRWVTSAKLSTGYAANFPYLLPPLSEVVIRKLSADGMLLLGTEYVLQHGEFLQAWWCKFPAPKTDQAHRVPQAESLAELTF